MADNKISIGYGIIFQIHDDSSPGDYIDIGYVTNVTPPSISRDAIDITSSSSANGWREFIPGLRDGGETSFEMLTVPNSLGITTVLAAVDSDQPSQCRIRIFGTSNPRWDFDAIVTGFENSAPIDDKMTSTVTLKITGKPTLTAT